MIATTLPLATDSEESLGGTLQARIKPIIGYSR
jgi:hypothetical protein